MGQAVIDVDRSENAMGPSLGPNDTHTFRSYNVLVHDASRAPGRGAGHRRARGVLRSGAGQSCAVTVDQRYAPRDTQCDIGAFEFLDFANVSTPIECTNTARTWSTVVRGTSGAFDIGGANVAVQTANAPAWVVPAQASGAVKLFWARR
jgi:hypothetical protein